MNEQEVKLAARLYDARDAVHTLFGDRAPVLLQPYMEALRIVADARYCGDVLEAVAHEAKEVEGMPRMMLIAAAVEIIEPRGGEACRMTTD